MSAHGGSGDHHKSKAEAVMSRVFILGLILFAAGVYAYFALPSYWRERVRLEMDVVRAHHVQNDSQMGREIASSRKADSNKKDFSMDDIRSTREAVMPSAHRAAAIDQVAKEWDAAAKGLMVPHPPRYLPGKQASWLDTQIPIFNGCTLIKVTGEISRGVYAKAGPDGIDLDNLPPKILEGYLDANDGKETLLKGVPWGTVSGKVCNDKGYCSAAFPVGSAKFITSSHGGMSGFLRLIPNGFVQKTPEGVLSGVPKLNMSDYNVYEGGFTFDQQQVPMAMCEAQTVPVTSH
jgi:hypothetical protein